MYNIVNDFTPEEEAEPFDESKYVGEEEGE